MRSNVSQDLLAFQSSPWKVQKTIKVPQVQYTDKIVDVLVVKQVHAPAIQEVLLDKIVVPVQKQKQTPAIQTVQKLVDVQQFQFIDKVVDVPAVKNVEVPMIQNVQKMLKVLIIETVEKGIDVPVVKQVEVPQIGTVEKVVEIPQVQGIKKIVEVPQIQQVPGEQRVCGLNGALYSVQMDADGGKSKWFFGLLHDLKFINVEANMERWIPSEQTRIKALATTEVAAQRSTCGRQTRWLLLTPCTIALQVSRPAVTALTAVTTMSKGFCDKNSP